MSDPYTSYLGDETNNRHETCYGDETYYGDVQQDVSQLAPAPDRAAGSQPGPDYRPQPGSGPQVYLQRSGGTSVGNDYQEFNVTESALGLLSYQQQSPQTVYPGQHGLHDSNSTRGLPNNPIVIVSLFDQGTDDIQSDPSTFGNSAQSSTDNSSEPVRLNKPKRKRKHEVKPMTCRPCRSGLHKTACSKAHARLDVDDDVKDSATPGIRVITYANPCENCSRKSREGRHVKCVTYINELNHRVDVRIAGT
ncbi:hypothetical protein M231_06752 [Tremella mesenterica]|uniref:Uncharacterized protein n=1 Tax=Tremella mesenterica TaxID=5217 RepID=A0A4Q1BG63_TREME|nr:hypothetical protein M231_06752 [Tremella mesenterica]